MNKAELSEILASNQDISKKQAEDTINLIFDTMIDVLKRGGEVTITGFGAFEVRERKGRTGVNPRNPTERIQIPTVRVPKFRAGKTLKDAVR
jgi:DNA-binding protein HU-beta